MTRTSAELVLLAALLVAAWFVVGHSTRVPASDGPVAHAGKALPADPVGNGLTERAGRLRALLASPPRATALARNPFSFSGSRAAAGPSAAQAARLPQPEPDEPRPDLALSGIAEETARGTPIRTAVIVAGGQLVFAREGDRVLSRFLVLRIAPDAVQLRDVERGDLLTLALK
jgi:hypothetical protein